MIIPLYPNQPELRLRLTRPGGRDIAQADCVRLTIVRDGGPEGVRLSELRFTGFWPGHDPDKERREDEASLPALVYPCFDVSDEGDLVFRFDELLWRRPPGRYLGRVELGEELLTELDLDLWGGHAALRRAEVVELDC